MDKRYLVFCYEGYYPRGGMGDVVESFDTEEKARKFCIAESKKEWRTDFIEIYDRIEGKFVEFDLDKQIEDNKHQEETKNENQDHK